MPFSLCGKMEPALLQTTNRLTIIRQIKPSALSDRVDVDWFFISRVERNCNMEVRADSANPHSFLEPGRVPIPQIQTFTKIQYLPIFTALPFKERLCYGGRVMYLVVTFSILLSHSVTPII